MQAVDPDTLNYIGKDGDVKSYRVKQRGESETLPNQDKHKFNRGDPIVYTSYKGKQTVDSAFQSINDTDKVRINARKRSR